MPCLEAVFMSGGAFNLLGDGETSVNNIAAWNGSAWAPLPSGSSNGLNAEVSALSVFGDMLYIGGAFTTLGDEVTSAQHIVAWNVSMWSSLTSGSSNGVNAGVSALSVFGDTLYIGGAFTTLGDGVTSARHVVAWNVSMWSNLTSGSSNGLNDGVYALSGFGDKLYIGGAFANFGNGFSSANYIVSWIP